MHLSFVNASRQALQWKMQDVSYKIHMLILKQQDSASQITKGTVDLQSVKQYGRQIKQRVLNWGLERLRCSWGWRGGGSSSGKKRTRQSGIVQLFLWNE